MSAGNPIAGVSLRRILVATDFSSSSQIAVYYAISLARRYEAKLYLAHIVGRDKDAAQPGSTTDQAWREGHRLTTDLLISGELKGIEHQLLIGEGEIWEALSRMVADNAVGLLVVGTRGRTGLSKVLLGSVAEHIFRQATCPVLTVGPNAPAGRVEDTGFRRILYATDFTEHSVAAASHAFSLASHYQAHLTLLHVIQDSGSESRVQKGRQLDEAKLRLRQLIPPGAALPVEPEFVVGFGTPAARILDVSAEKRPDLIVLGVRRPSSVSVRRRWSTASEVTGRALCPVLTVRTI